MAVGANRDSGPGDNRLTTISFASAERGAGFPARSRGGDNERIYRRALRHSRLVRWMRATVILAVSLVLLAVVADNYWPTGGLRLPGEIGNLVIKGTKITMQAPRLTGYTRDARPYEFTAVTAQQDITKPDFVELQEIHAKIAMADNSIVHLWADNGHYNMKTDMLDLKDNIHLVSSTGYEARLSQATVDVSKGNVVSDTPVWVKLLDGDLNAKHLEIADKGETLRFTDVTLVLQSAKQKTKAVQR
jgi:lipopolysaccharide export system protein LptC